jgi:hypothetical protein
MAGTLYQGTTNRSTHLDSLHEFSEKCTFKITTGIPRAQRFCNFVFIEFHWAGFN